MRNAQSIPAVAIALFAMMNVATAAPRSSNSHETGAAAGQPAAAGIGAFGAGAGDAGAAAPDPLFALLDTDGDGAISAKELHKAVAALKECDANHDGSIAWDEIVAASGAASQMRLGQGNSSTGIGAAGGGLGGEASQSFKRFMQYDKNHDGKLTVDEVPASMRDLDQNGDGVIDAKELQMAVERAGGRMNPGMTRGPGGLQNPGMNGRMPGGNPAGGASGAKSP